MVYLFSDKVKEESDKKHNPKNMSYEDHENLSRILWAGLYKLAGEENIIDFIDTKKHTDQSQMDFKSNLYIDIYQSKKKPIDEIKNKYDYKVFIKHAFLILP